MPDGIFRYGSILFRSLFDDGGEVSATAVFHENVENASVSIDISVVVSYNVVVMEVFEYVSGGYMKTSQTKRKEKNVHF